MLKRAQTELRDNLAKKDMLLKEAAVALEKLQAKNGLLEMARAALQPLKERAAAKAKPVGAANGAATSNSIGAQAQDHPHPPLPGPPGQLQVLGGVPWSECSSHGLSYEALCSAIESAAQTAKSLQELVNKAKTSTTAAWNPQLSDDATTTAVGVVKGAVGTLRRFISAAVSEGPPAVVLAVPGDAVVAAPPPRNKGRGLAHFLRKLTKKGRVEAAAAAATEHAKDITDRKLHAQLQSAGVAEKMPIFASLRTTFFKGPVTYRNSFFANVWRSSVVALRCVDDPSAVDGRVVISWQEDFAAAPSNSFYVSTAYADPAFKLELCEDVDFSKTPKVKNSAAWGARLARHWVAAPFRMTFSAISAVKNFFVGNRKNLPKQLLKTANCVKGRCRCVKLSDPVESRNDGILFGLAQKWNVKPGDNGETPAGRLSYLRLDLSDAEARVFGDTLNRFSASCTVARRRAEYSAQGARARDQAKAARRPTRSSSSTPSPAPFLFSRAAVRSVFGLVDERFNAVLREMSVTPAKLAAAHAELAAIEAGLAAVRDATKDLRRTKKMEQTVFSAAKELTSRFSNSVSHLASMVKTTIFGFNGYVTERSQAYGPDPRRVSAVVSAMRKRRTDAELWGDAEASAVMFHWAKPAAPDAKASDGTPAPSVALPPLLTLAPDDAAKATQAKTVTLWASEPVRPCHEFMQCFPQSYLRQGSFTGAFPVYDACGPHADAPSGTQCLCAVTAFGGEKGDGEAKELHMIADHVVPRVRRLRVSDTDARLIMKDQLAALRALKPVGLAEEGTADAATLARQAFKDVFEPLTPKDAGCRAVQSAALDVAYEDESKGWFGIFSTLFFFQIHVALAPLPGAPAGDDGAAARKNDFYCVWRSGPQFDALQTQILRSGGLVFDAPAPKIAACNRCPKADGVIGQGGLPEKVNQARCKYQAFVTEVLEKGGPVERSLLRDFLLRNPAGDDDRKGELEAFSGGVDGRKGYAGLPEPLATSVEMKTRLTQQCHEDTKPLIDLRIPDNECGRIMNSVPGAGGQLAPEKEKKGFIRRLFGGRSK